MWLYIMVCPYWKVTYPLKASHITFFSGLQRWSIRTPRVVVNAIQICSYSAWSGAFNQKQIFIRNLTYCPSFISVHSSFCGWVRILYIYYPSNSRQCVEGSELFAASNGCISQVIMQVYSVFEFQCICCHRYAAPEQYIMSTQTPSAPPAPVATALSPVLWQVTSHLVFPSLPSPSKSVLMLDVYDYRWIHLTDLISTVLA
jgi:hypothetical protein